MVDSALFEAEGTLLEHEVAGRERPCLEKSGVEKWEFSCSIMTVLVTAMILQHVRVANDHLMVLVH